jgi:hypothetical protein
MESELKVVVGFWHKLLDSPVFQKLFKARFFAIYNDFLSGSVHFVGTAPKFMTWLISAPGIFWF